MPDTFSPIGTLKHSGQIERAVILRLREWHSHYLAEVERQDDYTSGYAERLLSVQPISALRRWPEEQLPACFVVVSGTSEPAEKFGHGMYRARWDVGVMVVVAAAEEAEVRLLAQMHGAAVRGCLLQRRSLGGVLEAIDWIGESLDDLPVSESRSHQAAIQLFEAQMVDIVSWKEGPTTPTEPPIDPLPPLDPWPDAEVVEVDLTKEPSTDGRG